MIYKNSNLEVSQVGGSVASTVGLEGLLEKSAGGGTITKTVRHFLWQIIQIDQKLEIKFFDNTKNTTEPNRRTFTVKGKVNSCLT